MTTVNPTLVKFPLVPETAKGPVQWREISVGIQGPAEPTEACVFENNGTVFVSFKATLTGTYTVTCKHAGEILLHNPVSITVDQKQEGAPPPQEVQLPVQAKSTTRTIRFKVPSSGLSSEGLKIFIEDGPEKVPARMSIDNDGPDQLVVCIDFSLPGGYRIGIKKPSGEYIPNSPFNINVPESAFKQ
eukprot:TRINITY_DN11891_c0_g1_i1.p1 TRINITY_DN11891_c0_g1~~TRINITY_DN11891_c0_g1_i1.p1  ORF type:complete len:187 (-),score=35.48 TRINITY_DN11891_c0_g1_i1:29-589(-)